MVITKMSKEIKKEKTIKPEELEALGVYLKPNEFDFVYGYPSLNELLPHKETNIFMNPKNEFGIYIHIPFCSKICDFCYFVKITRNDEEFVSRYINALINEINFYGDLCAGKHVSFIYVGGGTPSVLSENLIEKLYCSINNKFELDSGTEITFEISPDSISYSKLQLLHSLGTNRISIGIQSFEDKITQKMNRSHSKEQSIKAIEDVLKLFKEKTNIDLIYGYPYSNTNILNADLEMCIKLDIPSITMYQLWTNVKNVMLSKESTISSNEIVADKIHIRNCFKENGYWQDKSDWYINNSNSKFRFQDHKWQNREFLGLGVSAYGYVNKTYYRNSTNIGWYLNKMQSKNASVFSSLLLSQEMEIRRAFVLGIKTINGVDLGILKQADQTLIRSIENKTKILVKYDFARIENNFFKLTEKGFLIPDNISELFYKNEYKKMGSYYEAPRA